MVKEFFDVLENPLDNPSCFHVLKVKDKVRMKADALIIKNNLDMVKFEKVKSQLLGYIPAALLPYIENG
jgi:adenylate cyclase 10